MTWDKMIEIKKYDMGWIRYVLTFVSVLIFLVGCLVVGYMAWVLATSITVNQFVSGTKVFSYTVITLGFLLFFTGLIGWVGSTSETICTLKLFLIFTAICMAVEIGGIATLNIMNTQVNDIIAHGWSDLNQGTRNLIQTKMGCCGFDGTADESVPDLFGADDSCYVSEGSTDEQSEDIGAPPRKMYEVGCSEKLKTWFEQNKASWVTGLASIGALQFMASVVAIFIMYKVKNEKPTHAFSRSRFRELSDELALSGKTVPKKEKKSSK